jgi:hypothetical protein
MISGSLIGQLKRWEGKWLAVYAIDDSRTPDGGIIPIQGELMDLGGDFLRIRQTDGYAVLYAATTVCSVGLMRDQKRVELMVMDLATDRVQEQTG